MQKKIDLITKGELKFWIMIITIIIGGVVMFTRLDSKVEAMTSREQINKSQFIKMVEAVERMDKTLVKMETNQGFIMRELGIE